MKLETILRAAVNSMIRSYEDGLITQYDLLIRLYDLLPQWDTDKD